MAKANPIPPFPADLDRDAFGHWLSGFTDGEACFWVGSNRSASMVKAIGKPYRMAWFTIKLRADDSDILRLIQSYFQCGRFVTNMENGCKVPNARPQVGFTVARVEDLHNVIVPHFDRYPLRAKKARDFQIWKRAVAILHSVKSDRIRSLGKDRTNGHFKGTFAKWSPEQDAEFASLVTLLRETRKLTTPQT
jgi:hypothetical protein